MKNFAVEINDLTKNYLAKNDFLNPLSFGKKNKSLKTNSQNNQKYHGIKNINLSVNRGEIFGFIGPNGAGKSTTINLLLNFIFADSGEAKILGFDILKQSKEIKKKIGYVPSEVKYYNKKVYDLLRYSASFYKNIDKNTTNKEITKICDELELDKKKKIFDLSLGNTKKVALAQSLLHRPELLILDEATNGLDPLIQKKLFEILLKQKQLGNTIFLSSHNLTEVEHFCDRVAIIKKGEIVEILDLKKITKNLGLKITLVSKDIKKIMPMIEPKNILEQENNSICFTYLNDINSLMQKISKCKIEKILIEKEDLQNKFLGYYS